MIRKTKINSINGIEVRYDMLMVGGIVFTLLVNNVRWLEQVEALKKLKSEWEKDGSPELVKMPKLHEDDVYLDFDGNQIGF